MQATVKPWIFETIDGLRDLTPQEVIITYKWVEENILPLLNLTKNDAIPVGSYGKKTNAEISSDIDVAISIDALTKNNLDMGPYHLNGIDAILQCHGYVTKQIPGFNQISFAAPLQSFGRWGFVQVDFMLSENLEWSKFIYHSPDFTINESKYKGVVRTLLLMAILSESTRNIISKDDNGNTILIESKVIRLPKGIYSTTRTFMGKKGLIKKAKLLKEHDKLITNDPLEATKLIVGKQYIPKDLSSFESIWKILNSHTFIHKEHLGLILDKFKLGLIINKLQVPIEAIKDYPQIFI